MPDLMGLLGMGAAGIAAQNSGIAVATNNVSNANTEGYSRQRVDMESLLGPPVDGGVRAGTPSRYASELLAARIRTGTGSLAMSQSSASAISDLEDTISASTGLDQRLASLFGKISQAAASPTDSVARDAVVQATRDLVTGMHDHAAAISDARAAADARIKDNTALASQLAAQLADANKLVARTGDPAAADHRDLVAKQLTELVGGQARIDADGQMRFVLDGGAVLVDGTRAAKLTTTPDATTGYAQISVVDGNVSRDVTQALGGGKLAADITFRDVTAAKSAAQLDRLAYDVATSFNGVHTANAGFDGSTGNAMFVAPTGVAGAAAALAIDPALDADSNKLALAAVGAGPGDAAGGRALFALATQPLAAGGTKTLTDAALDVAGDLGIAGAEAKGDVARDQLVNDNLAGLRDSLSGVDTQEELTNLARFEHASSAMTKFVSTIDDLLTSLIQDL